ncbi:MAG: DUF4124 domain-containing protein [Proteobacteria bacterium]|nr:DUF4124 domain-containing protein [Pseudomonadota bacterium]
MGRKRVWAGVLGILLAGPALAVFKCVGSDGRVTYTDGPCAADSRAQAVEVPPPLTPREEAEARGRGERLLEDARELDARRSAEVAERQRSQDAERRAEVQQREQVKEDAEHWSAVYPAAIYGRRWPSVKPVQPKPKPVQKDTLGKMNAYPFR